MPSVITGIIGGIQGASASHHAGEQASAGYQKASSIMSGAVTGAQQFDAQGNAIIGQGVTDANGTIAKGVTDANNTIGVGMTNANSTLSDVYKTATGLTQPYRDSGVAANTTLMKDLAPGGDLTQKFDASMMESQDPGYQFRLQQGQQALERGAAAAGGAMGGGAAKSLARYEQGEASSEYGAAFDRFQKQQQQTYSMLSGVADRGMVANNQELVAGQNFGQGTSNNDMVASGEAARNTVMGASEMGTNTMTGAARQQQGDEMAGTQGIQGAQIEGQDQIGSGIATAQGTVGAANAWNGMLGSIGSGLDSAIAGGFGGSGGFSLKGLATGIPQWG